MGDERSQSCCIGTSNPDAFHLLERHGQDHDRMSTMGSLSKRPDTLARRRYDHAYETGCALPTNIVILCNGLESRGISFGTVMQAVDQLPGISGSRAPCSCHIAARSCFTDEDVEVAQSDRSLILCHACHFAIFITYVWLSSSVFFSWFCLIDPFLSDRSLYFVLPNFYSTDAVTKRWKKQKQSISLRVFFFTSLRISFFPISSLLTTDGTVGVHMILPLTEVTPSITTSRKQNPTIYSPYLEL